MKHEKGEGEMGRCDMRTANTLSACVYAMSVRPRRENVSEKCACDTECVYRMARVRTEQAEHLAANSRGTLSTNLLFTDHH